MCTVMVHKCTNNNWDLKTFSLPLLFPIVLKLPHVSLCKRSVIQYCLCNVLSHPYLSLFPFLLIAIPTSYSQRSLIVSGYSSLSFITSKIKSVALGEALTSLCSLLVFWAYICFPRCILAATFAYVYICECCCKAPRRGLCLNVVLFSMFCNMENLGRFAVLEELNLLDALRNRLSATKWQRRVIIILVCLWVPNITVSRFQSLQDS